MSARDRYILFITEGITDRDALAEILLALRRSDTGIRFLFMRGDITSQYDRDGETVVTRLGDAVSQHLAKEKIPKEHVAEVIHLIDADGTYISDDLVVHVDGVRVSYRPDCIETQNITNIIERNARKAKNMNRLASLPKTCGIPYAAYYMASCLDFVLHNLQNATEEQKLELSDAFSERYSKDLAGFYELLSDVTVFHTGNYVDSWTYIRKDNNSLSRHSNMNLLFTSDAKNERVFLTREEFGEMR